MAETNRDLILIVRHAKAFDDHPDGDGARPLTAAGRRAFAVHAERVARHARLRGIVTSPLVRAVQTAELLAAAFEMRKVLVRADLAFGQATPSSVMAIVNEIGPGWAIVGHNPSLAQALALGLGLGEPPRFRKGAVAAIRTGQKSGLWTLAWVVPPGGKPAQSFG